MAENFSMKMNQPFVPQDTGKVNIINTSQYQRDFEEILAYMKSEEMLNLKVNNNDMYWNKLNLKNDGRVSYKMVDLLDEDFNNEGKIRKMLGILGDCKEGKKNIEDETKKFDEHVAEEYLYPSFGGKDNFLQKIAEMEAENKIKQELETANPVKKPSKLDTLRKATRSGGMRK